MYVVIVQASDGNGGAALQGMLVTVTNVIEPALGDYNHNGVVDAADYVIWRKTNSGSAAAYTTWRANFGALLPAVLGLMSGGMQVSKAGPRWAT